MLGLALLFSGTGLLLVGLAIPLLLRRVRPNRLYGLRCRATLQDESVWYDANAKSGRDLLALGITVVGSAVALPLVFDPSAERYGLAMSLLLVAGVLPLCVAGVRRANRLLAERGGRDG